MAPVRKGKRASTESAGSKSNDKTPRGPTQKRIMITQRQKQALIDNLQLEITDRARKLRAQYALQAQSLHTRIELRVNRIPSALRKVTMGELFEKHSKTSETAAATSAGTVKLTPKPAPAKSQRPVAAPAGRGMKRSSDVLEDDKENNSDPNQNSPSPKKRAKGGETRRAPNPATVLSPKSSNSRTLPHSPVRAQLGAAQKSAPGRPASPLKPASPIKPAAPSEKPRPARPATATGARKPATKQATTQEVRPYAARTKRGLAVTGGVERAASSASTASGTSGTSAGTTIVKKVGRALASSTTVKKTTTASTAAAKKTTARAAATKGAPAATTAARRTLRKRP